MRYKNGFTFIDVLVGTALLIIVMVGIFTGFQLLFRVLAQSQGRIIALALANEQIEIIRNLSYQDIGTQDGIPPGEIPQIRIKEIDNRLYTITTDIIYIDDPFDGISPDDELAADYKKARVEITWSEHELIKSVVEIANLSPPNLESEVSGGTLSLYVNDSQSGQPIVNAQTEIINDQVEPTVYIFTTTDDDGWLSRPGLPPSVNYEIHVSQTGHDEHRTHSASESLDPEPEYSHAQLIEGDKTTRYFLIAKVSTINLETVNDQNQTLGEIPFTLKGGRTIGINPIDDSKVYSYENNDLTTDLNGQRQFNDMSSGEYYLEVTSADYSVLTPNLERPLIVESDIQQSITITLAPVDQPYLRLLFKDASTGDDLFGAIVRLYNQEYDKISQSNEDGIAIFPFDEEDLINGDYTLSVSKTGYQDYSGSQTINDFTEAIVELIPLE